MKKKTTQITMMALLVFRLLCPGAFGPAFGPAFGAAFGAAAPPQESALPEGEPQEAAPSAAPQAEDPQAGIALHFDNMDLLQVIPIIAAELRMNYVVDPQVRGTVNINTLGELRRADLFPLLQMILRINGATAVQTGNFYRIVPLREVQRIPVEPIVDPSAASLPTDDRLVMNILPLKYVPAADMTKILTPFLSEGGHLFSHEAGNVLIITDGSQNMKRLLEVVAQFDTEVFANQQARLYAIESSQASKVASELRDVFSAYGLSGAASAVRFVPIERINSVLVVTASPSVYPEVERWLEKLDQPFRQSGARNFIYRVENGKAEDLANLLSQLLGVPGMAAYRPAPAPAQAAAGAGTPPAQAAVPAAPPAAVPTGISATGPAAELSQVRIVPDPVNNLLVIQATAQEFEEIRQVLRELDIQPRQVMIEAKVYEVDLTGALSAGVSAFLQNRTDAERKVLGDFSGPPGGAPSLSASLGTLVGKTRELLLFLNAAQSRSQARVISAPSILATDNMAASINVGTEIPILTSQVFGLGAQTADNPVFTNTIQNRDTGVMLTLTPRINSSGLVNLQIQQEVSAPIGTTGSIQSPSIQKRSISTQTVVQDGETIALGGIIQESRTLSKNRIPLLGDIPYVGALFGHTSLSSQKTELIILLTPTVIRNSAEAQQATAEFRNKLKDLRKILEDEEEKQREQQQQQQQQQD